MYADAPPDEPAARAHTTNDAAAIEALLRRLAAEPVTRLSTTVEELDGWWRRAPALADAAAHRWLLAAVAAQAATGWRPADVARAVTAIASGPQADLARHLREPGDLARWRAAHRLGGGAAARHVVALWATIRRLAVIPPVSDDDAAAAGVDAAVLAKVRALLAKAESTTFEAEAEALLAKAHQLMVRHAIDRAMLDGRSHRGAVTARRVFVDDPYARAKHVLLSEVARASSCQALLSTQYGFATVFGHQSDLDAVELLYTSLLLQATAGVATARPPARPGRAAASSQVAAYRRSWLLAFAGRIGERLREASTQTVAEAEVVHGAGLLPVLKARADAVEAAVREAAPQVRTMRVTSSSSAGWAAGAAAGDRASLDRQGAVGGSRRRLARG